jgi:sulfur carrier protein
MSIQITLNGRSINIKPDLTLPELLSSQGLEPERLVIEYNLEIVNKEDWEKCVLKSNDKIEVLSFVGGG